VFVEPAEDRAELHSSKPHRNAIEKMMTRSKLHTIATSQFEELNYLR
jgi:hypothetical protein